MSWTPAQLRTQRPTTPSTSMKLNRCPQMFHGQHIDTIALQWSTIDSLNVCVNSWQMPCVRRHPQPTFSSLTYFLYRLHSYIIAIISCREIMATNALAEQNSLHRTLNEDAQQVLYLTRAALSFILRVHNILRYAYDIHADIHTSWSPYMNTSELYALHKCSVYLHKLSTWCRGRICHG